MNKAQLKARITEAIRDQLIKNRSLEDFQFTDGKADQAATWQKISFAVTYTTGLQFEFIITRQADDDLFAAAVDFSYSDIKSQEIKAVAKLCDFVESKIDKTQVLEYMNELLQRRFRRGSEF